MAVYDVQNDYVSVEPEAVRGCSAVLGVIGFDDAVRRATEYGIPNAALDVLLSVDESIHQSYNGYDVFLISMPSQPDDVFAITKIAVLFSKARLLFVCDASLECVEGAINKARDNRESDLSRILCWFIEGVIKNDIKYIQDIEDQMQDFDDRLIKAAEVDYNGQVSEFRRRLVFLKQYYEQLSDITKNIDEDENNLISPEQEKRVNNLVNRISNLLADVINLRDYLSQIRDAYQAQNDIKLNEIMKLFTIISTIFLPLTLITSWYGMNLKMPEVDSYGTYPVIIAIMVAITIGCMWFFKKKKWW